MQSNLKHTLTQALATEISQETLNNLYEQLLANLHSLVRFYEEHHQNKQIRQSALSNATHFSIQDAVDRVFKNTNYNYNLKPTEPKGAFYPAIELENFIIIPKRSVHPNEWQRANYLKVLAQANKQVSPQPLDLFTQEQSVEKEKPLVIMDICYPDNILQISYLVPNSKLDYIVTSVHHDDIVKEFEKPMDTSQKVKPIAKLKKALKKLETVNE